VENFQTKMKFFQKESRGGIGTSLLCELLVFFRFVDCESKRPMKALVKFLRALLAGNFITFRHKT